MLQRAPRLFPSPRLVGGLGWLPAAHPAALALLLLSVEGEKSSCVPAAGEEIKDCHPEVPIAAPAPPAPLFLPPLLPYFHVPRAGESLAGHRGGWGVSSLGATPT